MPKNHRLQRTIIFLVLMSLIYGLLAQGAFYRNSFRIIQFALYLCSILWIGYWIWTKNVGFTRTGPDSRILLLLLALIITTVTSINLRNSLYDIQYYLTHALVYWLVVNNIKTEDLANLICATLISMGAILALTGLFGLVFRIEPLAMQTGGIWRIASTFTYPNAVAGYFVLILPITYHFSCSSQPQWQQLTFGLSFYVILLSLILTFSRGAWLSTLLIGLTILLVHIKSRNHIYRFLLFSLSAIATVPFFLVAQSDSYLLPLLATVAVCVLLVTFIYVDSSQAGGASPTSISKRRILKLAPPLLAVAIVLIGLNHSVLLPKILTSRILSQAGYEQRLISWKGALHIIKEHPIVGVGPGNFAQAFRRLHYPYTIEFAHNEYLQAFAETGILGFTSFVLLFYAIFKEGFLAAGRQTETRSKLLVLSLALGIAGFCLQSSFDFLWHIPVLFMTVFVLAGLMSTADRAATNQ